MNKCFGSFLTFIRTKEKESMTTVRSKVTSEHGNLANGGILNSRTSQNLYTKVALIFQSGFVRLYMKPK